MLIHSLITVVDENKNKLDLNLYLMKCNVI